MHLNTNESNNKTTPPPQVNYGNVTCKACGAPIPVGSHFCPYCKSAVEGVMAQQNSTVQPNHVHENTTSSSISGPQCPNCGSTHIKKYPTGGYILLHFFLAYITVSINLFVLAYMRITKGPKYKCLACRKVYRKNYNLN